MCSAPNAWHFGKQCPSLVRNRCLIFEEKQKLLPSVVDTDQAHVTSVVIAVVAVQRLDWFLLLLF